MIWSKNRSATATGPAERPKSPPVRPALKSRGIHFPIKEVAIWLFFTLTAMALSMPISVWLHQADEEDIMKLINALKPSKSSLKLSASPTFQPLAALPAVPMNLPVRFAPASADLSRTMASLSPSVDLLGKLNDPASIPPRFHHSLSKYDHIITETAGQYQVSPLLVKAIIQAESSFNPLAVSDRGAVGLMQVMPSTARAMGIEELTDPKNNITAGVRYLKKLLILFDDDERLAIAAYNCGPEAMKRWDNSPPYPETRNFIRRVMSYYNYYLS